MLNLFSRKSKAVKNWHSRAMLIDLRKTKLIIIKLKKTASKAFLSENRTGNK
jgi:hypothetical protein